MLLFHLEQSRVPLVQVGLPTMIILIRCRVCLSLYKIVILRMLAIELDTMRHAPNTRFPYLDTTPEAL
jgi:hypothetical protein